MEDIIVSSCDRAELMKILSEHGLTILKIAGDGHCLLNSIREALACNNNVNLTSTELIDKLEIEAFTNFEYYKDFLDDGMSCESEASANAVFEKFKFEFSNYVKYKKYTSDSVDICIPVLCNAIDMTLNIFDENSNGVISQICHKPLRIQSASSKYNVYVLRTGKSGCEHFDAVVKVHCKLFSSSPTTIKNTLKKTITQSKLSDMFARQKQSSMSTESSQKQSTCQSISQESSQKQSTGQSISQESSQKQSTGQSISQESSQKQSTGQSISKESSQKQSTGQSMSTIVHGNQDCTALCCMPGRSNPYIPSKKDKSEPGRRVFLPKWANDYNWLTYCDTRKIVLCFTCSHASQRGLVEPGPKFGSDVFVSTGFSNWKKATEKFQAHDQSELHRESLYKLDAQKHLNVLAQLSSSYSDQQKHRRQLFFRQLHGLLYLVRQGQSLRGHTDSEGNLHQLLLSEARSYENTELKQWVLNGTYSSHDIINEIIELTANNILRGLLEDIKHAGYFTLIADETMDISRKEQLCISLRWVGEQFQVFEDTIGLVQIDATNSEYITAAILDVLQRCNLNLSNCRGQAYDGAATMSGKYKGVSTRIHSLEHRAFYVHCSAHNLNLCLQDVCKNSDPVKAALDFTSEVVNIIRISPKRLVAFENLQKAQPDTESGDHGTLLFPKQNFNALKPLCPTRWTVRTAALESVIDNYAVLQEELAAIAKENSEAGRKANGYASLMDNFDTLFGLKLGILIFSASEQANKSLQSKDINYQEINTAIEALNKYLTRMRQDEMFRSFYENVLKLSDGLTDAPVLPRVRKRPRTFQDGSAPFEFQTVEEYFRQKYFQAIDAAIGAIHERFTENEGQQVMTSIEKLIVAATNEPQQINMELDENKWLLGYPEINCARLATQINMFCDFVKSMNERHALKLKKVTQISTIGDLFNLESSIGKTMFSEIYTLLRIYLTCPVSSATAERTFSTLRRLKTYLRSTMTEKRLNNLLILHTHKDRVDNVNLTEIAEAFISLNEHRQEYFGAFK